MVEVYQKHPVFLSLRTPSGFKGKCGVCEYNTICGGSRSRAFGVTGDPLESEPDCLHVPEKLRDIAAGIFVARNSFRRPQRCRCPSGVI